MSSAVSFNYHSTAPRIRQRRRQEFATTALALAFEEDTGPKEKTRRGGRVKLMPKVGVEPTLPEENYALNVARLPVPPLRLGSNWQYTPSCCAVNMRLAGNPLFQLGRACYNAARLASGFRLGGGSALRRIKPRYQAKSQSFSHHLLVCRLTGLVVILMLLAAGLALAQPQSSGVYAEAIGQANLRADHSIEAALIGEIRAGTRYPVLGRSAGFPWLLLGERDSDQPKGWVYEELVAVIGNINAVPLTELVVERAQATPIVTIVENATETATPTAITAISTPTPSQFGVSGIVTGEVNIRYGPGVEYPRVGVAFAGDQFAVTAYHTLYPWLRIRYDAAAGGQAWIARDLLETSGNIFNTPAISQTRFTLPPLTPTPVAVRASGINGEQALPLSAGLLNLANELWRLFLEAGFDPQTSRFGALFVLDLASGEAFTFGDDFAFSGTSLNKVAILAKLYQRLDTPPPIDTATDILNTMICSENAATNRLLSLIGDGNAYVGAEAVTAFLTQIGLSRSFLTAPFTTFGTPEAPPHPVLLPQTDADQIKADADLSNQLTVSEIGSLLANVYQCAYGDGGTLVQNFAEAVDARECRQMLHVMSNNTVDALLKSGVPADTRVAHKHGWIPDTHGNAALFYTAGGDYVVSMMLFQPEWLNFQESLPLFSEVSRRIYNYYNPEQPQASGREWNIPDVNSCNYFGHPLVADLLQWTWDT